MWQARALKEDERIRQYQEAQAARESRDKSARQEQQKATEAAIRQARRARATLQEPPSTALQSLLPVCS